MLERKIEWKIVSACTDTPIVLVVGARQSGKSTLLSSMVEKWGERAEVFNFDDLTTLEAAKNSPKVFLSSMSKPHNLLDEVQRALEIVLPLKETVDRKRLPGKYLLCGSANVLMQTNLADTLAGRMELITLWPLSQGEIRNTKEEFLERVFARRFSGWTTTCTPGEVAAAVEIGGFPEAVRRVSPARRRAWFGSYATTIIERDVRDWGEIDRLAQLPNLFKLLATRRGGLLNNSDLSRTLSIPNATLTRYLKTLEAVFLITPLRPWFANLGKRMVKSPKVYLTDTGLLCHLLNVDRLRLLKDSTMFGPALENFVVMELFKQIGFQGDEIEMSHYRTHTGTEVDVVLERDTRLVGVEIKSSSTVKSEMFTGLRRLKEDTKDRFVRGILLYLGEKTVSFGDGMYAVPVSALWES